ncbi:MAG: hypothetical protein GY753_08145 [Gammaproteobacteria bacterium]|nr:hypothetical protein [Gammaproteobacteria bacterium]
MKKVVVGVVAVVVVVVAAFTFLAGSLDSIVQTVIEEVGSSTTKTQVKVTGVNISLNDAQGRFSGLSVANPAGFSGNKAISLGEIKLKLDVDSLTREVMVIKEITINKPAVNYEFNKNGTNFDVIKKNVTSAGKSTDPESSNSAGPKIIIEDLYINNGSIAVTSALTGDKPIGAKLPKIHLKDIGKKSGGASAEEVAQLVLSSLTKRVGSVVGKLDLSQLKDVGAALQKTTGGATDKVKEGLSGAGDKLKGLLSK